MSTRWLNFWYGAKGVCLFGLVAAVSVRGEAGVGRPDRALDAWGDPVVEYAEPANFVPIRVH